MFENGDKFCAWQTAAVLFLSAKGAQIGKQIESKDVKAIHEAQSKMQCLISTIPALFNLNILLLKVQTILLLKKKTTNI